MVRDEVPPDPFADDPDDPAALLGPATDHGDGDLDVDREEVLADLADLDVFRALLEPLGVRGIAVECGECGGPHYVDWDLLRGSLQDLLADGRSRLHEPAYAPDPTQYVTWEYARGYADGTLDSEDDDRS